MDKLEAGFITREDLDKNEIVFLFRDLRPAPGMVVAHLVEKVKEWVEVFGVYNAVRILQYQLRVAMHACKEGELVVGHNDRGDVWKSNFTAYVERVSNTLGEDPDYGVLMDRFKITLAGSATLREHWQSRSDRFCPTLPPKLNLLPFLPL